MLTVFKGITEGVMGELDLSEVSFNKLKRLQLLSHSVSLECPKYVNHVE